MNKVNIFGSSLSDLIAEVQNCIPDFITLAISPLEEDSVEPFYMRINEIYIPLEYEAPCEKVNDFIDFLHHHVRYKSGSGSFGKPTVFSVRDYFKINSEILYEILRNLGEAPAIMFISKNEWFVDVVDSGFFHPIKKITASEFIDYLLELDDD